MKEFTIKVRDIERSILKQLYGKPKSKLDIYKDFAERVTICVTKNSPPKSPAERLDYIKARVLELQTALASPK